MSETFREESKKEWLKKDANSTNDDLKVGCLQRIADACELMIEDKQKLLQELNYLQKENKRLNQLNNKYWRAICAYKGMLKKKSKKKSLDK